MFLNSVLGMTNGTTNVTLMAFLASDFIYHPSGEAMPVWDIGQLILSQVLLVLRGVSIWRNVDDLWATRMGRPSWRNIFLSL